MDIEVTIEIIIILYVSGIGLILAEIFVPGGIIGLVGLLALITSIYFGFIHYGAWLGIIQIFVAVVILPIMLLFGLRRLTLKKSLQKEDGFTFGKKNQEQLLGLEGITLSKLRPVGNALVNGKKIDVVTEGEMIGKNIKIKVVKIEGYRVVVRPV